MLAYGLYNFVTEQYILSTIVVVYTTILFISWFIARKKSLAKTIYRSNVFLFMTIMIYLLTVGGSSGSLILWMYTLPLVAFFLFGEKEGIVWSSLLPICSGCKRIRDDEGYWNQLEDYIQEHSEAEFSHGYCPDCSDKAMYEFKKKNLK